ncbi:alpha-L-arabinofuranosidase C-terminal domain-containing protein [Belliella marina]|uniref:non-reducing end alpha-L-arabinofuranosidase n=1 Tax=Belliella marina TaxID=1644146 RepID=A0ABW4VLI8_9BACT
MKKGLVKRLSDMLSILFLGMIAFSTFSCDTSVDSQILGLSPTFSPEKDSLNGWEREYWSPKENYKIIPSESSALGVLAIEADSFSISRWYRKVQLKPYSTYKITAKIKAENVVSQGGKGGAGIRLGQIKIDNDTILVGTSDWISFEQEFNTEGFDSFLIESVLGKEGPAKGAIYLKDVEVREIALAELKPAVNIDLTVQKAPMEAYIYGQFIEHMGKCIYGGIWAELLEDRKFYYAPGAKNSPWKIWGSKISHDSNYKYSGNPTPLLDLSADQEQGLEQRNLKFKAKAYEGYFLLDIPDNVEPEVFWLSGDQKHAAEITSKEKSEGHTKVAFSFQPSGEVEAGGLGITAKGLGKMRLLAATLMPSDNVKGFRPDVLALMKELNAPIYRWPGGNFVSGYDWKDGLGDRDVRPTRYERAWDGLETNDVGIHEFMELCKLLDTDANIAVNTGLGTAKMAAEEVEYVNGDVSTKMGKWRADNGHEAPYNVKLWAVGNEMFGDWQLGNIPIEEYVVKHNEVAEAMIKVDPNIELIGVGFPGHWNDMMYEHSLDNMDYISEHIYKQDWHSGGLLTHARQLADLIKEVAEEHRKRSGDPEKPVLRIAMDEWNYWYGPHVHGLLGTRYFLRDALGIAAGLNEFSRQSDIYYMANYAQTVNVIGAIKATQTGSWMESTGLVLKMYRHHFGTIPVSLQGDHRPLDVAAALTEDNGFLTVAVVNANFEDYELTIGLDGNGVKNNGEMYIITSSDDMDFNEEKEEKITLESKMVTMDGGKVKVPKMSAVIYKFPVE